MRAIPIPGQGYGGDFDAVERTSIEPVEADWSWRALRALRRFGPRTVPALTEALRTAQDPDVRRFAAASLGYLGGEAREAAVDLCHAAEHDGDASVRGAARTALALLAGELPA